MPKQKENNKTFSFIDLFAGIGGFRLALEDLGGTCVFTSEWDMHAQKTYAANFKETPYGDITKINEEYFDIIKKNPLLFLAFISFL